MSPGLLTGLAPAKVNLFLHVGRLQTDGYHPLASLVAFADVGDVVTVEVADRLSLTVTGPFGQALASEPDNLILKALRALGRASGIGEPSVHVTLDKRLPIAAGLGGGSSDAGAALRLTRDLLDLAIDDEALKRVSSVVGADGPMCLSAQSAWAEGRGDVLTEAGRLPRLHAVLVNPDVPSSTGAVYRAFDAGPVAEVALGAGPVDWSPATVIDWLGQQRNDLEAPAIAIQPAIRDALHAVSIQPGVGLSRMSGSGATVFGLFVDADDAVRTAARLARDHSNWWVRNVILG